MNPIFLAVFWLCGYLALILAPLLILLIGPVPAGAGFWWDFSMALGFSGMTIMGIQFILTARFRRACAPFGIDIIYFFHRFLAVIGVTLIFAHVLIIWKTNPAAQKRQPRLQPLAISISDILQNSAESVKTLVLVGE